MATEVKYLCPKCRQAQWYSLFQALGSKAGGRLSCSSCKHDLEMQLTFSKRIGFDGRVVAAFLPDDINEWDEGKEHWEFYPFLVIVESLKNDEPGQKIWLPYWHKVTANDGGIRTPYGQWAPFIDINAFQQLLKKARKKGYLRGRVRELRGVT